jgi:hypothetical protein
MFLEDGQTSLTSIGQEWEYYAFLGEYLSSKELIGYIYSLDVYNAVLIDIRESVSEMLNGQLATLCFHPSDLDACISECEYD